MTTTSKPLSLSTTDSFVPRHIGPSDAETQAMLETLGYATLDELIDATIPEQIRLRRPLAIGGGLSEFEILGRLRELAAKNRVFRSYIGMGYADCITPPVIQRNIL